MSSNSLTNSKFAPRLGITTGDPAGVGPEVSLRVLAESDSSVQFHPVLFGDAETLRDTASSLGIPFEFEVISRDFLHSENPLPKRALVDVPAERARIRVGQGSPESGLAAARNIQECARACQSGRLRAMVTAPLNKQFLRAAGFNYPGHTELLANLAGSPQVGMAFLTETLKVVLVTIHLPLRIAIDRITPQAIIEKLRLTIQEFPRMGLACSRIAVAGVNPHAGEAGLLGTEEMERIEPALREARRLFPNVKLEGPVPADTVFYRASRGEFDVVLALFHDQGLTPIKLISFGEAVNVTLGLPYVRTSVDHGTAYDIAGKGIARPDSMRAAIRWAVRLANASL